MGMAYGDCDTSRMERYEVPGAPGWFILGPSEDSDYTSEGPNHSCVETERGFRGWFLTRSQGVQAVRWHLGIDKHPKMSATGWKS